MRVSFPLSFVLAFTPSLAVAQNRDHPGLVHLGDDEWGTPEQAAERELIEYRSRWYPKKMQKKLSKWEKEDTKKGLTWKDAYKEKTKYYRVKTNVPRFIFHTEIAPFLDTLGDTFSEVFQRDFGLKGKGVKNKDLKIYGTFADYSANESYGSGRLSRLVPGFTDGATLVVFYEDTDPAQFYGTAFHEGAHQFFLSLLPGASLPIWMDEGLATWFEGYTYSRATQTATYAGSPADRLTDAQSTLEQHDRSARELFMTVPDESFDAGHYALAWSFIHYLLKRPGEKNVQKFAKFLDEANGSGVKPIGEVFEKATKEDFDEVSKGWRDHVLALGEPADTIEWVVLDSVKGTGEGEDVRSDDLVWSIDGVEVFDAAKFNELFAARPKERPVELVLMRYDPSPVDEFASVERIETTLAPDSKLTFELATIDREGNLRD